MNQKYTTVLTPFFFYFKDHEMVASLLAKNGANLTINNAAGQSVIFFASSYGEHSI